MHPLIDKEMVDTIRSTGKTSKSLPDREDILREHGLPYDREADNAIITGCQILSMLPHVLSSLSRVLDRKNVSYTFLSEEYCCGNYLYRPAIKARDEDAMAQCRELSKEFVEKNILKAKTLGARRLTIFCSPCYPIYKHAFPEEDIVFYPVVISEVMGKVRFREDIDYYAGCYKLHRKFSPVPMDLKSTDQVFSKMEGLDVHRISAPKCCFTPEGLSHMTENILTRRMVHICTGCYGQALRNVPPDKGIEVLMLPELVERAFDI
ncbi:MAG: heterodisulfide reductase-related iron-sulfur binding cluster [Pseudomonadota bacterium]